MTIAVSAVTYKSTYGSYPPSLAAMGPPKPGSEYDCNAAGLLDNLTASGEKLGYVFEYIPGPPAENPIAGCPVGVKSFAAAARPLKYGVTGRRSYYFDGRLNIWATAEDRPATDRDCCVSYGCDDCKVVPDR